MFEEAIRYPWNGERRVETIAIGGVLTLLSVLVFPAFLVYGYVVRVVRQVSAGETETPPVFDDWEALFVDGLKVFVVTLVYSLVPMAVFALAVFTWFVPVFVTAGEAPRTLGVAGVLLGLAVALLALVASLAMVYVVPAAVAAFARTGRVGAAFSPRELRSVGGSGAYATGWLVAFGVLVLASVVTSAVSATVVGAVLVPFVTFYGTVSAAYAIGDGISDLPAVEDEDGTATVGRPAA